MWKLLKAARKAYKAWRSMDRQEREAVAAHAHRVRALAVEVGGAAAARFVDGSCEIDRGADVVAASQRPRDAVLADLRDAIEALSRVCARPGAQIVRDATPRSVRFGTRLAGAGARRLAPRIGRAASPVDRPSIPVGCQNPTAGWYADPSGRYEHRYWNGRFWTLHVMRNGVATTDSRASAFSDAHDGCDDGGSAVESQHQAPPS